VTHHKIVQDSHHLNYYTGIESVLQWLCWKEFGQNNRNKHPQQFGFTARRSTVDAILALRLLSELLYAFSRPLHAAYIDVKAAFDSVDRAALWKALKGAVTPPLLMHLLCDLHTGTTAKVSMPNGFSLPFHTSSGVQQGCILTPTLFCCAIDWLMWHCRSKLGIQVGSSTFTDIDYADYAVLFTADPAEWEEVLLSYETAANTMGLHCNWQKTSVTKFTYLGWDVVSGSSSTPEVHRRIGLANSIVGQLDRVWRNRRLSLNT